MEAIADTISNLTVRIASIAWGLFMLTWSIGWLLRGSPIPFLRVKRAGQDLVEDAVWAAFWLAIGTSIFALVSYIASLFGPPLASYNATSP
ncbi:MAG: DNA import protein CedA1 [Pyrodictiaceae archaeon]